MKFKVGDIVKIRRDSEFAEQSRLVGTIMNRDGIGTIWYQVKFTDGYSNSYRDYDLERAKKPKPKVFGIVSFCKKYYK